MMRNAQLVRVVQGKFAMAYVSAVVTSNYSQCLLVASSDFRLKRNCQRCAYVVVMSGDTAYAARYVVFLLHISDGNNAVDDCLSPLMRFHVRIPFRIFDHHQRTQH